MPGVLLVDDRPERLAALKTILEPLGQELVAVGSGADAFRVLLHRDDFAVILLDAQMEQIDEMAATIKQLERAKNIPIIFLTTISHRQRELLALQELVAVRREGAERYRQLADAMPQIVWTADAVGRTTYYNRRFIEYTGMHAEPGAKVGWADFVHPEDLEETVARRNETLRTGEVFEIEYRLRRMDGSYRWHLGHADPIRNEHGEIEVWIGTATDIDAHKRIERGQRFLLEAGAELASSLDYRATLATVARLAVPRIADWCSVDVVEPDGTIVQLAVEHSDPAKVDVARELRARHPPQPGAKAGEAAVIESGEARLVPEITDQMLAEAAVDETHLELLVKLGFRSWLCVPLVARGRTFGAISLVAAESGRTYDESDLQLAELLARRAAIAIDNARLYEEAEHRARASRALQTIADGVALLDNEGTVLLWNEAAEAITGLARQKVVGRRTDLLPLYAQAAAARVPLDGSRPETVPIEIEGRELWLSVSRVKFDEGTVYAFRDVTEERALDQLRSDMVATVSHELRTPLAAIHGAAVTLDRRESELEQDVRHSLMRVITEESERLAQTVGVVLLASHLDSGQLKLNVETVNAVKLTAGVVAAARLHLPEGVTIDFQPPSRLPEVAADEQHLRQVLMNLVENAVKYSPDGGAITVTLAKHDRHVEWTVSDEGLGIPAPERRRVFDKFYRLDPNMTRGIGGTGLGLYICRELVHRLDGRIWVDSEEGKGSAFYVRIPVATRPAKGKKPHARQAAATSPG
jgi:PAS domain S-box-containing protein